jgi:hypothetical protein
VKPQLLTIDVEAELVKLSLGRLRNRSQAPVALVRMAALAGARRVDVRLNRTLLGLEHDGQAPSARTVSALTTLFDRSRDDLTRHAALEELESMGMLDLLVACSLGGRRVTLEMGEPVNRILVVEPPGATSRPVARPRGIRLEVVGARRNPAAEARELAEALRYAGFRVSVNGQKLGRGLYLEDALFATRFAAEGVEGIVGLPRKGPAAVTRVLTHGVLEHESWESPADGWVWEAVVEGSQAYHPGLVGQVVRTQVSRLYDRARREFDSQDERDRIRIKQLLFRLADSGAGAEALAGVRLFRTVEGRRVDSGSLREAALGRVIRAVGAGAWLDRFDLSGPVFVLDEQERGFVERHMELLVREPARNPRGKRSWAGRIAEWLRSKARSLVRALVTRKAIPPRKLSPVEARFLEALNRVLKTGWFLQGGVQEAAMSGGRAGGWRHAENTGRGARLLLSRRHPKVRSMVAAYQRDPRSLFASLILLADGRRPFPDHQQEAFSHIISQGQRTGGAE